MDGNIFIFHHGIWQKSPIGQTDGWTDGRGGLAQRPVKEFEAAAAAAALAGQISDMLTVAELGTTETEEEEDGVFGGASCPLGQGVPFVH